MNPVETYLRELRDIHSTGAAVPETSYYGCLERLLNEVGKSLKPKVRCVINLANRGAGIPDGGLFTPDQIKKDDPNPMKGQTPSRGVIEVKSTAGDVPKIAAGEQVARYCKKYGLVLVTNYRDFTLIARDASGKVGPLESYRLAASEEEFWSAAAHPRTAAEQHGERFTGYLMRAMQHNAPLADPKDLAWFLASYARDALARVKGSNLPALASLRTALEESLGMKFRGDRGEHFFESTLIQTLFYGVFSAWVLWAKEHPPTDKAQFDWMHSASYLRVPVLRKLFHEAADPGQLDALNLSEVLNWATLALNRVDRASFFESFQQHHAVQYFYEPFLEAYDPELRKQLGVWYTPPEIVQYMVKRVDRVLREELGVEDGLADPRVYVLDPCCGTGAFLVGVFFRMAERRIVDKTRQGVVCYISNYSWLDGLSHTGMRERYIEAFDKIWIDNLHGDRMMSEYAPDGKTSETVFAMQGKSPGIRIGTRIALLVKTEGGGGEAKLHYKDFDQARAHDRRAALLASADALDNGTYGLLPHVAEIGFPFKPKAVGGSYLAWPLLTDLLPVSFSGVQSKQDQLVTDIDKDRLARRFKDYLDKSISNEEMGRKHPESMDGSYACDAAPTREKLQRSGSIDGVITPYLYRPFDLRWIYWEEEAKLIASKSPDFLPNVFVGNCFIEARKRESTSEWTRGTFVTALADNFGNGFSNFFPLSVLGARSQTLFGGHSSAPKPNLSEQAIAYLQSVFAVQPKGPASSSPGRSPGKRPPEISSSKGAQSSFDCAPGTVPLPNDDCAPLGLEGPRPPHPGLRPGLEDGCPVGAKDNSAESLFYHILAVLHAPAYRTENAGALRQDWPRIPLPSTREALEASAALGRRVAALLDVTQAVKGVTAGKIDPELRTIAVITKLPPDGQDHVTERINDADDLAVTAGWGNPGRGGITMPAGGKVVRREYQNDEGAFAEGTAPNGKPPTGPVPTKGLAVRRCEPTTNDKVLALGETTCDVYLNDQVYWKNVPACVWEYTLGGYQVIKKWLSYREHKMLGRPLRADEARYVTEMARRIAAILLLHTRLDENYRVVAAAVTTASSRPY